MEDKIDMSEREEWFKPHTSLLDAPYVRENSLIKVGVFYLSTDGCLGRDAFRVKAGKTLAISLVGDMEGHGREGREKIKPILLELDKLAEIGCSSTFGKAKITREIIGLDNLLGPHEMITLSFVRISADGTIHYITSGENKLIVYKRDKLYDLSAEKGIGKIGILKYIPQLKERLAEIVSLREDSLFSGDRLLICTDGVTDPKNDLSQEDKRIIDIENALKRSKSIEEIVRRINQPIYNELKFRKMKLYDDYTIIVIERK